MGDSNGMFYSLDAASGKEGWHQKLNGMIIGSALVAGDTIFVGTDSGTVYYLDRSGAILHSPVIDGKVYAQPVAVGDLVMVAPALTDSKLPFLVALDQTGVKKWDTPPAK
jgi:outer membrane protein assembly factor BamB